MQQYFVAACPVMNYCPFLRKRRGEYALGVHYLPSLTISSNPITKNAPTNPKNKPVKNAVQTAIISSYIPLDMLSDTSDNSRLLRIVRAVSG